MAEKRLHLIVAAEPHRLIELRRVVREYLDSLSASDDVQTRAEAAVHEACSNVVRHAYGAEGGPLHLSGERKGERVEFVVSDNGTPVADPNAGPGAGLGLHMMAVLADDVDVEGPGPKGTRVRLTFLLRDG
jgi:anti-sigma regulatory factor (Ser/Thr protein kinase)